MYPRHFECYETLVLFLYAMKNVVSLGCRFQGCGSKVSPVVRSFAVLDLPHGCAIQQSVWVVACGLRVQFLKSLVD